jgi:coproporphyrinogen III oxidase
MSLLIQFLELIRINFIPVAHRDNRRSIGNAFFSFVSVNEYYHMRSISSSIFPSPEGITTTFGFLLSIILQGHGITAVLQRGDLLEKAACSTTIVRGILSEERAKSISSRGNR